MAGRADTVIPARPALPLWPGWLAGLMLCALLLAPLAAVLARAGGAGWPGAADLAALRFTVVQAVLSALISVALAVPVARALARRRFPGRGALITLLGAPFILPVIVAVLGLLAVFGRGGVANDLLAWLGLPQIQIYGLHGVVLAHVFFNLPLATRMILQGWQAIPAERFRLAASLGMPPATVLRVLERPMLRSVLPGAALIVFALCLSSFAVALTLGGGPRATTLELAIYQAFRFDFDLGRAAVLAALQLALVMGAAMLALRAGDVTGFGGGLDRPQRRWEAETPLLRTQDAALIALAAAFLLTPLAAIVWRGAAGVLTLPAQVWQAAAVSLGVALVATALCIMMAMALALLALRHRWIEGFGLLGLAISPLVIGTGLFLMVHPFADPARLALPVTALVNAAMALPFALRVILPRLREVEATHGRLATSLGMRGAARLRWLIWPRLRPVLGFAAGLAAALAMGDLGVIALFADPDTATLPLQILRLMGAYRMDHAAGAGLVLLILSLGLFWLFDRGGRDHAAT